MRDKTLSVAQSVQWAARELGVGSLLGLLSRVTHTPVFSYQQNKEEYKLEWKSRLAFANKAGSKESCQPGVTNAVNQTTTVKTPLLMMIS